MEFNKAVTFWKGFEAEYTGKTIQLHGAIFYEIRIVEGFMTGQIKLTQAAPKAVR